MGAVAVIVINCQHESSVKSGKDRKGNQRMKCNACGKYFLAPTVRPIGDMRISPKQAAQAATFCGVSARAVASVPTKVVMFRSGLKGS